VRIEALANRVRGVDQARNTALVVQVDQDGFVGHWHFSIVEL
jgi:hypothetical protein